MPFFQLKVVAGQPMGIAMWRDVQLISPIQSHDDDDDDFRISDLPVIWLYHPHLAISKPDLQHFFAVTVYLLWKISL